MILFGNKNLISAQIYTLLIPNGNKKKRFIMNSQDLTKLQADNNINTQNALHLWRAFVYGES